MCTGESGQCPPDVYMKNGSPCGATNIEKASGKLREKFLCPLTYMLQ